MSSFLKPWLAASLHSNNAPRACRAQLVKLERPIVRALCPWMDISLSHIVASAVAMSHCLVFAFSSLLQQHLGRTVRLCLICDGEFQTSAVLMTPAIRSLHEV